MAGPSPIELPASSRLGENSRKNYPSLQIQPWVRALSVSRVHAERQNETQNQEHAGPSICGYLEGNGKRLSKYQEDQRYR